MDQIRHKPGNIQELLDLLGKIKSKRKPYLILQHMIQFFRLPTLFSNVPILYSKKEEFKLFYNYWSISLNESIMIGWYNVSSFLICILKEILLILKITDIDILTSFHSSIIVYYIK